MIRKAVIPAAGFGTRFLPASKSQPKEMLPIVDTPTIQYVIEEVVAAGITDILMIIGKGKRAIEEHFDRNFELEAELEETGKQEELRAVRRISSLANIHFVWQKELNGLGDAVSCARSHVGNEPFYLALGDTLIDPAARVVREMIRAFERYQESVILLEEVDRAKVGRYGVVGGKRVGAGLWLIDRFVEKPKPSEAPSNLAIAARYILTPEIFDAIARTKPARNGEIQLTDAMSRLVRERAAYGVLLKGERYDIGNKLDFLKTNVAFGLRRPDIGRDFRKYLRKVAAEL
ncbi:MAG: UTP--glucose-1-phosphate uridylyltransferase GalU [Verrucomicrobiae bacterium]|nr:UTP--glucose-1-phosphate uridylyltransferase GalU [Verrucomicrobiae bacterium]